MTDYAYRNKFLVFIRSRLNTKTPFETNLITALPEGLTTPPETCHSFLPLSPPAMLFIIILILLGGCTPDNPTIPRYEPSEYPGMVLYHARNKQATLGSMSEGAQTDEIPVTRCRFSYDFSMDTSEVTVGSYRLLCGTLPAEYDTLSSSDPQLPVIYVSWFDAVLYCNKRSKAEGLDTVYSYTGIEKNNEGAIFSLSDLKVEYGRCGYRLPTEAEWVFAARGQEPWRFIWGDESSADSADLHSWYVGNSGGTLHPVATRPPATSGIYDLTGNAAEWVNDCKSALPGGTVTDFAGGGNTAIAERILKGGSYSHDLTYLRLTCRSDQYPVDAGSKNRYTGFRCVIGAIGKPAFLAENSGNDSLEPVSLVTSSLISAIGTIHAKLVFVNRSGGSLRTLCFVDYSTPPVEIRQFASPTEVFNPVISPDGEWVAWASRDEGSFSNGSVFVRKLSFSDTSIVTLPDTPAFVPRWYVDQAAQDTFVLYVTSAQLNDLATWTTTQTRMMRFQAGAFTGDPEIVEPEGAFHGGRSVDGDYLATGYPLLRMKHLPSRTEKILFYAPLNGKAPGDTSQVCNVSISPSLSNSDQVLFLDFGSGRDTSTLTNTAYHSHEYLFRGDYSGTVTAWYRVPAPFYSWNFTEWSTHPNYAVGAAAATDGAHRALFCLNLTDGSITPLCEGTDLYHPYLWIAAGSDTITMELDSDSLGWYDYPHFTNPQTRFLYKMKLFWHYADSLDVAFVGSSVACDGIDPRRFTDLLGLNMAVGAGDMATAWVAIERYLLNHCPRLKIIGMSFDMNFFFMDGGAADLFGSFSQSKGFYYDRDHRFWKDGLPPAFNYLMDAVPLPESEPPSWELFDSLGLARYSCRGWGTSPPPIFNADKTTPQDSRCRKNIQRLIEIFDLCAAKNVKVLLVAFPMSPNYLDTDFYTALGPPHATAGVLIHEVDSIAAARDNVTFYDAHRFGQHDYSEDLFFDPLHLCVNGAEQLSTRIDSIMHEMLEE